MAEISIKTIKQIQGADFKIILWTNEPEKLPKTEAWCKE
jgi:hypothetical protein